MLANYTLLSILGEGSHGKVYLARHTNGSLYAIKKCNIKTSITDEDKILTNCVNPLIQGIFEKIPLGNYNYLVLDYYKEGDLHEYLCQCYYYCAPKELVVEWLRDIIDGVIFLHSNGVIHRDLKLENIMLCQNKPIICDFNLSHYDKNKLRYKKYKDVIVVEPDVILDEFLGTLEYLAPEIVNCQTYDCMIDWWSLGVLTYELLYSFTPFNGETEEEILNDIKSEKEIIFNKTPIGELTDNMKDFIIHLLQFKITDRLGFLGGGIEIKEHNVFK